MLEYIGINSPVDDLLRILANKSKGRIRVLFANCREQLRAECEAYQEVILMESSFPKDSSEEEFKWAQVALSQGEHYDLVVEYQFKKALLSVFNDIFRPVEQFISMVSEIRCDLLLASYRSGDEDDQLGLWLKMFDSEFEALLADYGVRIKDK